jgi:hypothetical protein
MIYIILGLVTLFVIFILVQGFLKYNGISNSFSNLAAYATQENAEGFLKKSQKLGWLARFLMKSIFTGTAKTMGTQFMLRIATSEQIRNDTKGLIEVELVRLGALI